MQLIWDKITSSSHMTKTHCSLQSRPRRQTMSQMLSLVLFLASLTSLTLTVNAATQSRYNDVMERYDVNKSRTMT